MSVEAGKDKQRNLSPSDIDVVLGEGNIGDNKSLPRFVRDLWRHTSRVSSAFRHLYFHFPLTSSRFLFKSTFFLSLFIVYYTKCFQLNFKSHLELKFFLFLFMYRFSRSFDLLYSYYFFSLMVILHVF